MFTEEFLRLSLLKDALDIHGCHASPENVCEACIDAFEEVEDIEAEVELKMEQENHTGKDLLLLIKELKKKYWKIV